MFYEVGLPQCYVINTFKTFTLATRKKKVSYNEEQTYKNEGKRG